MRQMRYCIYRMRSHTTNAMNAISHAINVISDECDISDTSHTCDIASLIPRPRHLRLLGVRRIGDLNDAARAALAPLLGDDDDSRRRQRRASAAPSRPLLLPRPPPPQPHRRRRTSWSTRRSKSSARTTFPSTAPPALSHAINATNAISHAINAISHATNAINAISHAINAICTVPMG
jgi:hypothetical protein